MKAFIAILLFSLSVGAQEFGPVENEVPTFEPVDNMAWVPAVNSLLLEQEIVTAPAPDTGDGTCSIIIDGILYIFWCDVNEPLPEFGNE